VSFVGEGEGEAEIKNSGNGIRERSFGRNIREN